MAKIRGYHVIENTPGDMPDSEPAHFTSKREAMAYMTSLARELRDDGYTVSGTAASGYYAEQDASDLGRMIEMMPCEEIACQDED